MNRMFACRFFAIAHGVKRRRAERARIPGA
jgi:hypothetical protein